MRSALSVIDPRHTARSQGLSIHFTEHRCHVLQGQLNLNELRDGISISDPNGQLGRLSCIICFCLKALQDMDSEGAALNPDLRCAPASETFDSELQSYTTQWPSQQHGCVVAQ